MEALHFLLEDFAIFSSPCHRFAGSGFDQGLYLGPLAVEAWSLNHGTTREVPGSIADLIHIITGPPQWSPEAADLVFSHY